MKERIYVLNVILVVLYCVSYKKEDRKRETEIVRVRYSCLDLPDPVLILKSVWSRDPT